MLGIEGYIILLIIALAIVIANFVVNRGNKTDKSDNSKEQ